MALVVMAACLFLFGIIMLRRALPFAVSGVVAWWVWNSTRDLSATCGAGFAALCLTAIALDVAASSSSQSVRRIVIGVELIAAIVAAGVLAFALFQEGQSPVSLGAIMLAAAFIGAGSVLQKRTR